MRNFVSHCASVEGSHLSRLEGRTYRGALHYAYYNIDANGKGGARKDHALNPINTDFDLFSPGPDGQSKSQITQKSSVDDVIRASNGRFVGTAAEFAAR